MTGNAAPFVVRQSDLKTWAKCPLMYKFQNIDQVPRLQSASLTFGSIMHECVLWMEVNQNLEVATERFAFYWADPTRFTRDMADGQDYRIDYYVKGTNWRKYNDLGPELLRKWWAIIQWDSALVLGREFTFDVPIGNGHILHGTIDKLEICYYGKLDTYAVKISDYKTNNKVPTYGYLEEDLQFSAYAYATTLLTFWEQLCAANGWPAEQARELFEQYKDLPRRGEWVSLVDSKRMDAGERTQRHYARLIMAVDALELSVAMRIFVPNISGESCRYCDFRNHCGLPAIEENR